MDAATKPPVDDTSARWPPPEQRLVGMGALVELLHQRLDEEDARLAAAAQTG